MELKNEIAVSQTGEAMCRDKRLANDPVCPVRLRADADGNPGGGFWIAGGKAGVLGLGCPARRGCPMPSILFQPIQMMSTFALPKGTWARFSPQTNQNRAGVP